MMLKRALAYADLGWAVFPLLPNSKEPLTKHGFKDASKDPAIIKRWWAEHPSANIGIATGIISDLVVVDVDVKNGAKGFESLATLGELPVTLAVQTPSGGQHLYHVAPGPLRCRIGLLPGIDIKADGGYVVAPGSTIDGKDYEWIDAEAQLVMLPDTITKLMAEKKPVKASGEGEIITEGKRNDTLASIAGGLRRHNKCLDEIFAELKDVNTKRCQPPLSDSEVETIARSICNYPAGAAEQDDDIRPPGFTDDALALEFTERYGEDWRYVAAWGYWLHW
ncbi:MAG TPA: bifunctional DNA primase/polymerase, partial [Elusimicrobiales bacterium]|nr:bifunctional DNA primase/polymerase [Elusimicrobiales bacterium]